MAKTTVKKHVRQGKPVKKYKRGKPGKLKRDSVSRTYVWRDPDTGRIFGRSSYKRNK